MSIVLKSNRDRSLRNRHPWVFSGAAKEHPKASPGSIVEVRTNSGDLLAHGFYNPNSRIICRVLEFGSDERTFDEAFWIERIRQAHALRQQLLPKDTDAYRLLHAEGDRIPGFIADVYGDIVVVQVLTKGTELVFDHLCAGLRSVGFEKIVVKNKEGVERFEKVELENGWVGEEKGDMRPVISEHGLQFIVDVESGQKTGFYLDQRENRHLLRSMAEGKDILNTFSYTGGFSVAALAGGASSVISVDSAAGAIELAEENVAMNGGEDATARHEAIAADCFEYLRGTPRDFDVVVLDPPSFARTPKAVNRAARGYKDLNLNAINRLRPGGLLFTFSCTGVVDRDLFRKIVFSAAADTGRPVRILHQLSQPFDHPIDIYHPEGEYLKGLVLQVG